MSALPAAFADLAPFAEKWARPTEAARGAVRLQASAADFAAFHAAMAPRLSDLLALLATHPAKPETDEQRAALELVCAYAEAAPHHELYGGSAEVPHSFDARRFVPAHGDDPL